MLNLVEKFTPEAVEATNEDGVVTLEYVILAAGIALVVAGVVTALGGLGGKLQEIVDTINPAAD
jgi:Flp pilus assembly pilin Flp